MVPALRVLHDDRLLLLLLHVSLAVAFASLGVGCRDKGKGKGKGCSEISSVFGCLSDCHHLGKLYLV